MGKNKKNRNKPKPGSVVESRQNLKERAPVLRGMPLRRKIILAGIVAVLAIFLYAGSYGHDFAYDDAAVIKSNRFVQQGFSGIGDILKTQYFEGFDPASNARAYRPVSMVSFAIEYEFFGLNPQVYHAVNILIYALTAIILLFVLLRLLGNYHWSLAFSTTILFVIHPVHVDVVANIKSRDELLGFFNFLLAVFFLLRDLDKPNWKKKILSYVFFFLALASKETLLTTVACIPLLLYYFRDMNISRIGRVSLPYLALFFIFLLIRAAVIPAVEENVPLMSHLDNPLLAAQNLNERIGTNIYSMGLYLQTLVFPYRLAPDYSYNSIPLTGMSNPVVIAWLLGYIFLIIVAIRGLRQKTIFSFCIWWFFITISIVSSIFILSSNVYADRFLYTPSLAVCLAAAFALYKLAGISREEVIHLARTGARRGIAAMLLLFLGGLGVYKTISYVPVWKNDSSLFTYNLKVNPNNARMRFNYGAVLIQQAMAKQEQAFLQNQPMDTGSINDLARQGIAELQKGTVIFPGDATAKIHEGNGWIVLRNIEAAENNLRQALTISPNNRFALTSLGGLLLNTRRYQEAAQTWEKINPDLRTPGDYYNLSLAYQALGDQQKAGYYKQLSGR
ncbi:MAG TPA: DUF1736 domain-containing protein [Chitinophagaceae bacterium]|nr:DUF1736 domain-containing protein [Chitinophagaceae bacterium]